MTLSNIIVLCLIFLLILGISYSIITKLEEIHRILEGCKAKGYDGIKFVSKYSSDVVCSNFTQAERDTRKIRESIE